MKTAAEETDFPFGFPLRLLCFHLPMSMSSATAALIGMLRAFRALLAVGIGIRNPQRIGHRINNAVAAHGSAADSLHIQRLAVNDFTDHRILGTVEIPWILENVTIIS